MINIVVVLTLFVVCSSIKSLYLYVEMQIPAQLLFLHAIFALGSSTIFVLLTLRSRRRIWFVMWYLLHTCILFVNTNYFEFFGKILHLSAAVVFIPELFALIKSLDIPLNRADLIFVIDFPLFLYLLNKHGKIEIPLRQFTIIIRTTIGVTALAIAMLFTVSKHFNYLQKDDEIVYRFGIIGHNIIDLLTPVNDNKYDVIKYGDQVTSNKTSDHFPNIILIQIESLDANIVNYQYHGEYVTPFLHNLTSKSFYFPFTLCYRKLGGTSDCEIAINNSIEPPTNFALIKENHYIYPNSVVKVLKKNGYNAVAFHGNTGLFYNRISAYAAMGYDKFIDPTQMKISEEEQRNVSDHDLMNAVEKHLQKVKSPFFASIITLSSHEPFNYFKHYDFEPDKRFNEVEPMLTQRYFSAIAYTDRVVGEFVAKIQKKYPDTYFFLYGDHTPFVINEGPFHRSLLKEMEMVPLFIITPKGQLHYEHDAVASYLDVAPTILHAAGIEYSYRSLGVDLLDNMPLQKPVSYRGQPYNRSVLFKEMSEAYGTPWK